MSEPFTKKLAESSACLKCANYWQSVVRVGLPFIIFFQGIDYVVSRITGKTALTHPWWLTAIMSILAMFTVSTLWWVLMREVAASRQKNQEQKGT